MDKMFKVSAIAAALVGTLASGSALATSDSVSPEYKEGVSEFFSESTVSGNVNFFMRARDRAGKDVDGNDTAKTANLDHGSIFVNLGFNSGYINDTVGADFVVYSTWDMWNNASFEHEFNFFDCDTPYGANCDSFETDNGVSFAKAALKFKLGENAKAQLGYFQPTVPSSLGVNWSFAPGTYRGGEIGGNIAGFDLGFVFADQYKAPWFKETYKFEQGKFWGSESDKEVGEIYSLGARYGFENGMSLDVGYGALTDGPRKNFHVKLKDTTESGLYWSPQLYVVEDDFQFDSTAWQAALLTSFSKGAYSFRVEGTYTSADAADDRAWGDKAVGNMAYRLTEQYGGSNGAYEIWWNNRSDFNHDGEYAGFVSVSRDFSDVGAPGFSAGISGAMGMGAKHDDFDELKEYAYSLFMGYGIQGGPLKGGAVSFHYTQYFNDTDAEDWGAYTNAFNDETDFKLALTLPFSVK
ncbi:multidrug transporter [Vibrio variabilis]|uniref:Multidrug transporter n=1 Tax=Vibrio variabilis TaxID=990271 RepID=A0ABR4Y944_9VIBR|nr:OprD family outer membrane porin [Vibrio variabilis]KHA59983.1 multidrug transporter [Vibrio variabilis]